MKIGFTGTRHGMSTPQYNALYALFGKFRLTEFHHGDCIGADDEAAKMVAHQLFFQRTCRIIGHPPTDDTHRAFFKHNDFERLAKPYLERNRDIVDACDVLIACPLEPEPQLRGGTWSTINYARKVGKPVYVITPDGTVTQAVGAFVETVTLPEPVGSDHGG